MLVETNEDKEFNIASDYYFIAQTEVICWTCKKSTRVVGMIVPADFREIEDWSDGSAVIEHENAAFVQDISLLSSDTTMHLQRTTPKFYMDNSKTAETSYWMNHCEHCGAKQGEFFLFSEPGVAFFPTNEDEMKDISVIRVDGPFRARGSVSFGSADAVLNRTS